MASAPLPTERGIVLQLADGTIQACNSAAQALLGLTLAQLRTWPTGNVGQALQADGSPFTPETHPVQVTSQTGQVCRDVVMGWQRPGGERVWLLISTEPLLSLEATPYGVLVTLVDITGFPSVQETPSALTAASCPLAEGWQACDRIPAPSEEAFFFDHSLDLLAVIGLDGRFRQVNAVFTQTLGYSETELLATSFLEFVHPEDRTAAMAEVERLNIGTPTFNFENRYRTQAGDYRWLAWTASPEVERGVIYCAARDITQQKQTEAIRQELETALQRANQELEQRVARRTHQLEAANAALRESEERNQLAMAAAQMFTFEWEPHTDIVKRSPQCKPILGLTGAVAEQDTGKAFFQRIHPDDRDRFVAVLRSLTPEHNTYKITYRLNSPQGQTVTLEESGRALFDAQGQFVRLIGMTSDITQRKQAEQRSRESEERLRLGMQVTGFALARIDYVSNRVELSPEAATLYGLPADQRIVPRQRIHATFHPDERAELLQLIEQVLDPAGSGWFARDHRVVWSNGTVKWLTVRKQVFFDRTGKLPKPTYAILVALDVTERKQVEAERQQAEVALRRSEERYRMLFESMEDGFCVIEVLFDEHTQPIDYRFLEVNPAFEQQTGLQQAEGKTARQLLPDLEPFWFETYGKVALTGEPVRFENGSDVMHRWFDVYAFPIGQSESRKVALLFKEISDRKATEAQREQFLRQEQAAREAAERANQVKDEFLAVLSHELRTPLNPILGWAKLLQSPRITAEKFQQGLSTIERNAKQQVQLIDDLLDISRIIRGKLSLTFTTLNLVEPITAALETVQLAAEAKAIQLEVKLEPLTAGVRGDAGRLQQVVWNLLSNAIKFTATNGRVRVHLTQVDHQAQIQVRDTGKGIHPDFLPHVFELFRQQDSSTTRHFGGLGLGLAIARQVVEAHGGTITADSAGEEQGATFTVQLPLITVPEADVPDLLNNQTLDCENLRVLVVDDEPDSLEMIQIVLVQEGAMVQAATSAPAALRLLTQSPFDLLISDIGMPQMDGYAFLRQVRTLPPQCNRDIPAIALTAYAGETNQQQVFAAGFQVHLVKPIDPQHLLHAIAALVRPQLDL